MFSVVKYFQLNLNLNFKKFNYWSVIILAKSNLLFEISLQRGDINNQKRNEALKNSLIRKFNLKKN